MASGSSKTKTAGEVSRLISTLTSSDVASVLSNIADLAEGLELSRTDFSPAEAGALIKLQSERLARLVDTLAVTEQVESGAYQVNREPIVLRPVLDGVISDLGPLSERYAMQFRIGRKRTHRPILADTTLIAPILSSTLEGVIRTTVSSRVRIDTVSHDDKLFVHITDKDAAMVKADTEGKRAQLSSHAIAIPSFFVASSLMRAVSGELRMAASKNLRHIDLVFPHSIQLRMEMS